MFGKQEVFDHLVSDGFMVGYTSWTHCGEGLWQSDPVVNSSSQCEGDNASRDKIDQILLEAFVMYDTHSLEEDEGVTNMAPFMPFRVILVIE